MNYTPFLISDFATGFDRERQPWLLPNDAQFELLDGYVYRGVWQKREGYSQFATGERNGHPYCESRMVHRITGFATVGVINGINTVFTASLTVPAGQAIRRGGVTVIGTVPAQSFTDNGLGGFTGATGTINYTTGALSITLPVAPAAGSVTVTYNLHQSLPVMGVMNFFTQTSTRQLIVADTTYVNRYNPTTNVLEDISPSVLLTGNNTNFFSWTNYPSPSGLQRLLFVNYKDPIQQYSGSTVTTFPVYTVSTQFTNVASGVLGNGTTGPYVIAGPTNIVPGSLSIIDPTTPQTVTDNTIGGLQGQGTGTVNYITGAISVTFTAAVGIGNAINLTYRQLSGAIDTCRHIFSFKDRLVLLSTIESSVQFGLRIRISGTGAFGDIFTTDAIGAGFIDIPDNTFIQAADFNRDDLLIFTESSTWVLKYTSNDVVPFALDKIDESRGSQAPYGTITYLNKTNALSPRGLIMTDGYSVIRTDDKIPDYSFNSISQSRFFQCFAGSVDEDRDHYLIHPGPGRQVSDRILVTNYEEDNYAVYRIPLSCMGNFEGAFDINWNDLSIYNNWDELAAIYGNWYSFSYSEGAPISIGGGHNGQITRLNVTEVEDYPVKIRNITIPDPLHLQITTDFQDWEIGDIVEIDGIQGMVEANDKQGAISSIITPNYTFQIAINTSGFSSYTSSGVASKVIQFTTKTKKFNPFSEHNQKVRCGWVYFYVSTTGTDLTQNAFIQGASQSDPCIITLPGHGYTTGMQIFIDGVLGMTELNSIYYYITVIDDDTFSLDGVDSTGFTAYVSGGVCTTPVDAKLQVRVIVNDTEQSTDVFPYNPAPYEVNLTNAQAENGIKKWYKLYINQIGRFVQLEFGNAQSGTKIEIQAIMPGMSGVGRLI